VAPTAVGLLVRRLSWWQNIVGNVSHHGQFLAAFFGRCEFEKQAAKSNRPVSVSTLNEQGEIDARAHPWARQLSSDLECLISH
ncbi:unnamed protein product, partial [Prorocentrum cordatum]